MIVDGRKISEKIVADLKKQVADLGFRPVFYDIMVGDDPVSMSYVNIKGRKAREAGIDFILGKYPEDITQDRLIGEIISICGMDRVSGLIIQLPLPSRMELQPVLDSIDPEIDVDCIGSENSGLFYAGKPRFIPPTAGAVMHILEEVGADYAGRSFLVVGEGRLVGKPVAHLLRQKGYSVKVAKKGTPDLEQNLREADVVISGTGQPGLISFSMVKPRSILIDAGTAESSGQIVGDVKPDKAMETEEFILSPVPGGVGPVTVAKLLQNVLIAARLKISRAGQGKN